MIYSKQMIKEFNTTEIFNLINEKMPISRARIAQITGLSPTTVSTLTQNMIDYGIVIETGVGRPASSGRRPVMIEVNPAGAYVAAMEVTQEALTCALFDAACREMIRQDRPIADHNGLGLLIRDSLAGLVQAAGISQEKLRGLSVGIPAILDPKTKRILSSTILPIDPGVDFLEPVRQAYPGRFISAATNHPSLPTPSGRSAAADTRSISCMSTSTSESARASSSTGRSIPVRREAPGKSGI
jgi:hypothetical protein